jgi:hypothetical protein
MQPKEEYFFGYTQGEREISCPGEKGHVISRAAQGMASLTEE